MKVTYVRAAKTKGFLNLGIETEEGVVKFSLSERDYSRLGAPLSGDVLTDDVYEELMLLDMRYKAKRRALNILSYGDNSERALTMKLIRAGVKSDIARDVTEEMVRLGYVNKSRQLEKLIINEVNLRNTGPCKLIPKLIAKGYSHSDIEAKIDELSELGEISFDQAKKRLIERLPEGADAEEIRKTLYKNGYSICLKDF